VTARQNHVRLAAGGFCESSFWCHSQNSKPSWVCSVARRRYMGNLWLVTRRPWEARLWDGGSLQLWRSLRHFFSIFFPSRDRPVLMIAVSNHLTHAGTREEVSRLSVSHFSFCAQSPKSSFVQVWEEKGESAEFTNGDLASLVFWDAIVHLHEEIARTNSLVWDTSGSGNWEYEVQYPETADQPAFLGHVHSACTRFFTGYDILHRKALAYIRPTWIC
jgi:hypothetical protein